MDLSITSFFSRYINHPLSAELSNKDKVKATIATLFLGVCTLGMAHLYCSLRTPRRITPGPPSPHALTMTSFFSRYINHPFSHDLSANEKIAATVSSVAIGILTLGIAQIACAIWGLRQRKIVHKKEEAIIVHFGRMAQPKPVLSIDELLPPFRYGPEVVFSAGEVGFENMGSVIQSFLIDPYFAQPLPKPSDVEVPLPEGGKAPWMALTSDQKIDVYNTKVQPDSRVEKTEWGKEHVDSFFMPGGQEPYLPHDPKERYGSDHAARTALFVPLFAYLYAKYDPHVSSVCRGEVLVSQILGAGVGCARQTEGPDVSDDDGIHQTMNVLQATGCRDERVLALARAAIIDKDSPPGPEKSLIAKLIQNSDCVDSSRLRLSGPSQSEDDFRASEKLLDIYTELRQVADANDGTLKNGLTWTDFQEELEMLRWEMDRLIYTTHQRKFRETASQPGIKYYDEIVATINEESYPYLFGILQSMGVVKRSPIIQEKIAEGRRRQGLICIESWMKNGIETEPTSLLERGIIFLKTLPMNEKRARYEAQIVREIEIRRHAREEFDKLLLEKPEENVKNVAFAFARLPFLLKQQYRSSLERYFPCLSQCSADDMAYRILRAEMLYTELCACIDHRPPGEALERANQLRRRAEELLEIERHIREEVQDPSLQTACAVACDVAASLYLSLQRNREAREVFQMAADRLTVWPMNGLARAWTTTGDMFAEDEVVFFSTDCHRVRKRSLRVCEKVIDESPVTEISFEVTTQSREALAKALDLLGEGHCCSVPAIYPRRVAGKNAYSTTDRPVKVGRDLKITVAEGIEIFIGEEQSKWNQYHLMRIRVKKGVPLQSVQKALSLIGLPTVLMNSRDEDQRHELMARSISFRFPSLLPAGDPTKDALKVYHALEPWQKALVDHDMQSVQEAYIGPQETCPVQPMLAEEAWLSGARALGTFVDAGDMDTAGEIIANILKNGFLSSQERFSRGILGLGCAPLYNYETGSANQVFTRVLTKDQFTARYCLDNLAVIGKVFFILDLQAFERMPYSYLYDRGGLRNPHYALEYFAPEKQEPIRDYKGSERILERPGFPQVVTRQVQKPHPTNETMFDLFLGAQYINRIVVASEEDRATILKVFRSKGIFEINGLSIESAVVVTNCLHPGMVPGFYQSRYSSETNLAL